VQDKRLIPRLAKVGRNLVPAERAGAGNDKRLRGWISGLEELAQATEDFAEDVYKRLADVRFTKRSYVSSASLGSLEVE
jgi:hypothetical protein